MGIIERKREKEQMYISSLYIYIFTIILIIFSFFTKTYSSIILFTSINTTPFLFPCILGMAYAQGGAFTDYVLRNYKVTKLHFESHLNPVLRYPKKGIKKSPTQLRIGDLLVRILMYQSFRVNQL